MSVGKPVLNCFIAFTVSEFDSELNICGRKADIQSESQSGLTSILESFPSSSGSRFASIGP